MNTGRTHFKKGYIPWNKGLTGYVNAGSFKIGERKAKDNQNWKGDNVGYIALHSWVRRNLGIPQKCGFCGDISERKYEWANKSRLYKRDLQDWIRLCVPCHANYDDYVNKGWKTRKEKLLFL